MLSQMFAFARIFHANSNPVCRRAYDDLLQMLQSPMWAQLARLSDNAAEIKVNFRIIKSRAVKVGGVYGPTQFYLKAAGNILDMHNNSNNVWFASSQRNIAIAAELLQRNNVIAVPTDTVYGLACLPNDPACIQKLYDIKGRDFTKPVAICVGKREDIGKYGVLTEQHKKILPALLPGPFTIILKRTENVHQDLNPGHDTIGIRVVDLWFIRALTGIVGPIALTSANKSGEQSCIAVEEFSELWPQLGGVFHYPYLQKSTRHRQGSTIFDLSIPGKYSVVRKGFAYSFGIKQLRAYGITSIEETNSNHDVLEAAVQN